MLENTDLTDSEILYLQSFRKCIYPVFEAINVLSTKSEFSNFLVVLLNLRKKLRSLERDMRVSHDKRFALVESQIKGLEQRFDDFFQMNDGGILAAVASFSNPQYKFLWLKRFEHAGQRENISQMVLNAVTKEVNVTDDKAREPQAGVDSLENLLVFSQDENDVHVYEFNDAHTELTNYSQDHRNNREMLKDFPVLRKVFSKYNSVPLSVNNLLTNEVIKSIPTFLQLSDLDFEYSMLYKINVENQK